MTTKILVCGLPGSGKTTLARKITNKLVGNGVTVLHLNADEIRKLYDDWDFSLAGRFRQARRMTQLATESSADFVVADFVAPLTLLREIFDADYTICMETIAESRFADTNALFEPVISADIRIKTFNSELWAHIISEEVQVVSQQKV